VYASVFYKDSKAYLTATQNLIDQEKMAIVLQEVVGSPHGKYTDAEGKERDAYFYPTLSGVARSLNFYPIGDEQPEDGIASLAIGLGKYIVDGGVTLRVSPKHPHHILQLSDTEMALRETQTRFYALDLRTAETTEALSPDDAFNLRRLSLKDADAHDTLRYVSSTYDPYDQIIRDGYYPGGRKIISFSNILQHDLFPLASTISKLLEVGKLEMGRPVEIEFALDIKSTPNGNKRAEFYLLQIRPIVDSKEVVEEDLSLIPETDTLITTHNCLGNGIITDVTDVVYVKSEGFNAANNQQAAYDIERINTELTSQECGYVLVGPGRWGSSDPWLGLPVKWPHISGARVIVECGLENYRIDPSQGTHFFQNLTSFGVGYFTINPFRGDGFFNEAQLNALPAEHETAYVRHVKLPQPLTIKMDGRKGRGVVM
jgi:hypothetical protein